MKEAYHVLGACLVGSRINGVRGVLRMRWEKQKRQACKTGETGARMGRTEIRKRTGRFRCNRIREQRSGEG